jgi:glycosyltransferase involved in cell wall biosynthesis/O-antigen/teichoic acid export membrane protein
MLVARSLTALRWGYIGTVVRIVLQLATQVVLARLIGPSSFGLFAATMVVVLLLGIIVECGLGVALVQARIIQPSDIATAFSRVLLGAGAASGMIFLAADFIAAWYEEAEIANVLRWMTLAVVFQALGIVSLGLLRRDLKLRTIQIAQVSAYLVGFGVVGVVCALLGAGVWSLVSAFIAQCFIETAIMYAAVRHPLRLMLVTQQTGVTRYGLRVAAANLANLSNESVENVMIGGVFGTKALGMYSLASNLVRTLLSHVVSSFQQVSLSFWANAGDDLHLMRYAYVCVFWLAAVVLFPVFLTVGALAPTLIQAIYGESWLPAIPLLTPLALTMPLVCGTVIAGSLLWGSGRVVLELRASASTAILMAILLAMCSSISIVATAWGVWFVNLVRALLIISSASQSIGVSMVRLLAAIRCGALLGAATSAILFVVDTILAEAIRSAQARLVIDACFTAILLPTLAVALSRSLLPTELKIALNALESHLPKQLHTFVKRFIEPWKPVTRASPRCSDTDCMAKSVKEMGSSSAPVRQPRHVLIASYVPPSVPCGVRTYYRLLQEHLPAHGFEVTLVTPSGCSGAIRVITGGVRWLLIRRGFVRGANRLLVENLICWIRLRSALKRIVVPPDLVHAQDPGSASAALSAYRERIAVVTTCHFNDDLADEALMRHRLGVESANHLRRWHDWTLSKTRNWISVSHYAARLLKQSLPPDAAVRVVHNGMDFRELTEAQSGWDTCDRTSGGFVVLTVGDVEPRKNQVLVLDVAERLMDQPVVFAIIGDGPDRSWLEEQIALRSLAGRVLILGYRNDVKQFMRGCSMYFHPALNENCSFAVLEAIAAGLPVIATASGGTPEIFAETASASCFAVDTPPEVIAQHIRKWIECPDLRSSIAQRQRDVAHQKFCLAQMIKGTLAVYEELLRAPPKRP